MRPESSPSLGSGAKGTIIHLSIKPQSEASPQVGGTQVLDGAWWAWRGGRWNATSEKHFFMQTAIKIGGNFFIAPPCFLACIFSQRLGWFSAADF